jgi:hypothetical protein
MRSDERRHPLWPVRRALSWGFLRAPVRSGHLPLVWGFQCQAFLIQVFIVSIPMFDRRNHPSAPTMIVAGYGGGRRSRMARRATAEGGAQRP